MKLNGPRHYDLCYVGMTYLESCMSKLPSSTSMAYIISQVMMLIIESLYAGSSHLVLGLPRVFSSHLLTQTYFSPFRPPLNTTMSEVQSVAAFATLDSSVYSGLMFSNPYIFCCFSIDPCHAQHSSPKPQFECINIFLPFDFSRPGFRPTPHNRKYQGIHQLHALSL